MRAGRQKAEEERNVNTMKRKQKTKELDISNKKQNGA